MTDSTLLFEMGGFNAQCECLELVGATLKYRRAPAAYMWEFEQSIDLDADALTRFWQTVEIIGVWNWRESYEDPAILDGVQWSLKMGQGSRRLVCAGSNLFPPNQTGNYSASSEFGRFLAAIRRLSGLPRLGLR